MKQALNNLVQWIIVSSADASEVYLTVKAALVAVIPTLKAEAGIAHVNLGDGSLLTTLVEDIAQLIQTTLTLIATAMAVYGSLRKIFFLAFPKNTTATL